MGFAGDTFNTAWYLAQVSTAARVGYFTAVGDDDLSQDMLEFIRDSGIADTYVQRVPNKTVGLYRIHLREGERSFTYWRDTSAARELAANEDLLSAALDAADLIYFSGITLAILEEASRDTLLRTVAKARAKGKVIAFDPNLRRRLWRSADEMTSKITQAASLADLVLPSFEDEADWFGDSDPEATLDRYFELGASHVVVKDGNNPVTFRSDGNQTQVLVPPIGVPEDTTAAGDSFNAGVLNGLIEGRGIYKSILEGCALAGHVIQQSGALVDVG
ncbi:2-dehydro-3-deoxygluconokinase [Pontivivens insulae]|uniref:2-dehydro-3-deoxygluconokinase n=2 Tax=Pontivivens insulae TaxID=1639689 RepID=A0A2R8A958_9RHOB|nr:2-dehydro-3-deoxygluconokinase [Pontivivens insulae]